MFVQKYLVKQNEIGFDDFRLRYGKLAYNKDDSDEPAPEVEVSDQWSVVSDQLSVVSGR